MNLLDSLIDELGGEHELPTDHISASQINTYLRCPMQYYFRYKEGLKIPPTEALTTGKAIHAAIEYNYKQKMETRADLPVKEVQEVFAAVLDELKDETDWGGMKPSEAKDDGVKAVKAYHEKVAKKTQPVAVEKKIEVPFGETILLGYIDLIDDKNMIRDTKTTKRSPGQRILSDDIQLSSYAWAYKQLYGELPSGVQLDFIVRTKSPKIVQMPGHQDDFTIKRFEKTATRVIEAIKNNSFYPNPHNFMCGPTKCGYWEVCHKEV